MTKFATLTAYTMELGAKAAPEQMIKSKKLEDGDDALQGNAEDITEGYKLLKPDEKKETFKRLCDCHDEPAAKIGSAEGILIMFKLLEPAEKKALIRRLKDFQ